MNDKTILLTGISGFVAKHCAVELLRHGYRVRGTVRSRAKGDRVRETLARHVDVSGLEFAVADLLADDGWGEATRGVHGVLHVASPFPNGEPEDPESLLRPAVDGTLRVLKSALAARVSRFVETSSTAAVVQGHPHARTEPFTEADWTVAESPRVGAYARSKTLAEKAARKLVSENPGAIHFSSINPGFVLGPVLDRELGTSADAILTFLKGRYPGAPRLSFPVVDVRDVARMHRLALETNEPSGGRYLAVSETAWFIDMMRPIRARLGALARKVPRFEMPDLVVRAVGVFDRSARSIVPDLGRFVVIDNRRTRAALGVDFIPVTESAPAMAQSLVDLGLAS